MKYRCYQDLKTSKVLDRLIEDIRLLNRQQLESSIKSLVITIRSFTTILVVWHYHISRARNNMSTKLLGKQWNLDM